MEADKLSGPKASLKGSIVARLAQLRNVAHAPDSQTNAYCRIAIKCTPASSDPDSPDNFANCKVERIHADGKVLYNGIRYCSLSEAAFGALMETYIPNFKVIEGETFQISIGNGRSVDFMINSCLIEYHQPRLHPEHGKTGDYESKEDYQVFEREIRRAGNNSWKKQRLIDETSKKLAANYYAKRIMKVRENPEFKDTELIVAASREEFYQKVILRFCEGHHPGLGEFITKFWWWVNTIAEQNGLPLVKKAA